MTYLYFFLNRFLFLHQRLEIKLFYMAFEKYIVSLHRYLVSSLGQNSPNNWIKPESRAWKSLNSDLYARGRWQKTAPCSSSWAELSLCCNAATHHFQLPGKTLTHKVDTSSKPTRFAHYKAGMLHFLGTVVLLPVPELKRLTPDVAKQSTQQAKIPLH